MSSPVVRSAKKHNEYQGQQEYKGHQASNLGCREAAHWFVPSAAVGTVPVAPLAVRRRSVQDVFSIVVALFVALDPGHTPPFGAPKARLKNHGKKGGEE